MEIFLFFFKKRSLHIIVINHKIIRKYNNSEK